MRRNRQPCATCGKVVLHLDGRPWPAHVRSMQHQGGLILVVQRIERRGRILTERR